MKKLIGFVFAVLFVMAHSGVSVAINAPVAEKMAEPESAASPAEDADANGKMVEDVNGEESEESEEGEEGEPSTPMAGSPASSDDED